MKLEIDDDSLKKLISIKIAIKKLAEKNKINAFVIQCWSMLQKIFGVYPCLANSLLFDEKIPVICEGDVHGAISALIAQAATFNENPVFFADLTIRNPENDNSELLWHCGSFPYSLRKNGQKGSVSNHYLGKNLSPGICNWEINGGNVSIIRFDGSNGDYFLFSSEAEGIDGPKMKGTYLWIKVKDWNLWEERLVMGPYIHHVAGIHGNLNPILYEASKYLNGIHFDCVEPNINEIKNWLAGK